MEIFVEKSSMPVPSLRAKRDGLFSNFSSLPSVQESLIDRKRKKKKDRFEMIDTLSIKKNRGSDERRFHAWQLKWKSCVVEKKRETKCVYNDCEKGKEIKKKKVTMRLREDR